MTNELALEASLSRLPNHAWSKTQWRNVGSFLQVKATGLVIKWEITPVRNASPFCVGYTSIPYDYPSPVNPG
jgi:hypothetical protein